MSKERELLKEFIDFVDSYEFYPTERSVIWEIVNRANAILAQPEQESVYQKLSRIEDGVEVEILPSELWQDGYEAGKRSVLLSKQPEQDPVAWILKEKETGYKTQVAWKPSVLKKGWEAIPLYPEQPLE